MLLERSITKNFPTVPCVSDGLAVNRVARERQLRVMEQDQARTVTLTTPRQQVRIYANYLVERYSVSAYLDETRSLKPSETTLVMV